MGFTPQQVDAMSLWQYMAALDGFASDGQDGLSDKEVDELWDWIKEG